MTDTSQIRIHTFRTSEEAYNKSQTGYYEYPEGEPAYIEVKDGDVILIPEQGIVGLMNDAWPVAFTQNHGQLHHPNGEPGWNHLANRYAGWTMETVAKFVKSYGLEMVDPATLPYTAPPPKRCDHLETQPDGKVTGCNTIVAETETNCGAHVKLVPINEFEWTDDYSYHRTLTCKNHPQNRFSTKNPWDRTIFCLTGDCPCPISDLMVVVQEEGN